MTELKKPVRRETTLLLDNRLAVRDKDRIIVTLYPDQTIGFRQYRSRREYRLPLTTCYRMAILANSQTGKRVKDKINRGVLR